MEICHAAIDQKHMHSEGVRLCVALDVVVCSCACLDRLSQRCPASNSGGTSPRRSWIRRDRVVDSRIAGIKIFDVQCK